MSATVFHSRVTLPHLYLVSIFVERYFETLKILFFLFCEFPTSLTLLPWPYVFALCTVFLASKKRSVNKECRLQDSKLQIWLMAILKFTGGY